MNWESRSRRPTQRASAFWKGLWPAFLEVRAYFPPNLWNGSHFCFWLNDWMGSGVLQTRFPCLFALAQEWQTMVTEYWLDIWWLEFRGRLSAPWSQELLDLLRSLADFRPTVSEIDKWVWDGPCFSARAAYDRPSTLAACQTIWKRKLPLKVKIFGWLLLPSHLPKQHMRIR